MAIALETHKATTAKGKFKIKNPKGLHSIPSTELVKRATSFKSHIFLTYQKQRVNAKSLLSILMLAAVKGATITIEAKGDDAEQAVLSIIELADNNFFLNY